MIALSGRLLDNDEPGILATLFCAKGSTYRSLGAMMVGGPGGAVAGGVSGGCLEEYIVRQGRELTRQRDALILSFDTSFDDMDAGKPVPGCGGSIEVLVERLRRDHLEYLQRLAESYDGDSAALTSCTIEVVNGTVSVCRRWGRCGMDEATADLARQALSDRRSYCGRTGENRRCLVHYVPPLTRLVILGAGDDVRPLCDLGKSLGWHVTVADRRTRPARAERFPSANAVIAAPWDALIDRIQFTPNTAVILMTHSLPDDAILLPLLANKACAYVGVLGPEHRLDALLPCALENGPINDEFVARLHGPIGLDLGDRSAAGIAVSVIAEIVGHLNERSGRRLSNLSRAIPSDLLSSTDA